MRIIFMDITSEMHKAVQLARTLQTPIDRIELTEEEARQYVKEVGRWAFTADLDILPGVELGTYMGHKVVIES